MQKNVFAYLSLCDEWSQVEINKPNKKLYNIKCVYWLTLRNNSKQYWTIYCAWICMLLSCPFISLITHHPKWFMKGEYGFCWIQWNNYEQLHVWRWCRITPVLFITLGTRSSCVFSFKWKGKRKSLVMTHIKWKFSSILLKVSLSGSTALSIALWFISIEFSFHTNVMPLSLWSK